MFQSLVDALQSNDIPKRESCLALNLLFQFLFKELRNAEKVRHWFRHKLSLEFEELLTRTTTGKLFDCVSVSYIITLVFVTVIIVGYIIFLIFCAWSLHVCRELSMIVSQLTSLWQSSEQYCTEAMERSPV